MGEISGQAQRDGGRAAPQIKNYIGWCKAREIFSKALNEQPARVIKIRTCVESDLLRVIHEFWFGNPLHRSFSICYREQIFSSLLPHPAKVCIDCKNNEFGIVKPLFSTVKPVIYLKEIILVKYQEGVKIVCSVMKYTFYVKALHPSQRC
jgi:hypothetical protein